MESDAAYDSNALRRDLAQRGVRGEIKPMPGRLIAIRLSRRLYKERNAVERFFNKMEHSRAVATRYEKNPRELPRPRQAHRSQNLHAIYESVT